MKASVIISVYKNIKALHTILLSLNKQTEQDFEIIISEDGENAEMRTFIENFSFQQPYVHLTQPDTGWNKNRALNRAILTAKADYLIFIDGDCVLHSRFVEMHLRYAQPNAIVAGKRVKLNIELSNWMQNDFETAFQRINCKLLPRLVARKGCRYVEEAFYLPFLTRKVKHVTGSNMSLYKDALLRINGFDENYHLPAVGEDYDLEWRLLAMGYKIVSVRNLAIQYHLWHKENWVEQSENMAYCRKQQEAHTVICAQGINQHIDI